MVMVMAIADEQNETKGSDFGLRVAKKDDNRRRGPPELNKFFDHTNRQKRKINPTNNKNTIFFNSLLATVGGDVTTIKRETLMHTNRGAILKGLKKKLNNNNLF